MKYDKCLICGTKINWSGRKLKYKGMLCPKCDKLTEKEVNKVYGFFCRDIGVMFGGKLRKDMMITEWDNIIEKFKK